MRGGSDVVGSPLTEEQLAEELKELELELAEESGGLEEVGGSAAHLVEQHPYTEAVREENRQKRQQATAEKQQERKAVSALKKEEQQGEKEKENIEKIYITASGGPFINLPNKRFDKIKLSDALKHPSWRMGKKITIDSATLMNKVFEVIEAKNIFNTCLLYTSPSPRDRG